MQNKGLLAISVFDANLDVADKESKNRGKGKSREPVSPILSIPTMKTVPITRRHLIIVAKSKINANEFSDGKISDNGTLGKLSHTLKARIEESINEKIPDATIREKLVSDIKIEFVPVENKNIWNLDSCSQAIGNALTAKIGNGATPKGLVINLVGGTAFERTALYLSTLKLLRRTRKENDPVTLNVIKCSDENTTRRNYVHVNLKQPQPIGLLAQGIGTKNPVYSAMLDRLEQIILTSRNEKILITGPTGAGKSELAKLVMAYMRALHKNVTDANCIHQNVAAITPTLIESELFGYDPGAFTGARSTGHKGIFERANNGVLFLDEIGALPKELQVKLLTVLDGTPFTRIEGSEKITSDFLLLCGTNVNLRDACENKDFRRDLFERLRTWTIEVPPINNRLEDLEVALQRERGEWLAKTGIEIRFQKTNQKGEVKGNNKTKGNNKEIDHEIDALSLFMKKARAHQWVGNFREFHATFVHLAMTAEKGSITNEAIEDEFRQMEKLVSDKTPPGETSRTEYDMSEAIEEKFRQMEKPVSDKMSPGETSGTEYDMVDMARLACALDVCRKAKTASEAGEVLFAARAETAKRNETQFNGASSLQRLFAHFGLKATFKHGTFSLRTM